MTRQHTSVKRDAHWFTSTSPVKDERVKAKAASILAKPCQSNCSGDRLGERECKRTLSASDSLMHSLCLWPMVLLWEVRRGWTWLDLRHDLPSLTGAHSMPIHLTSPTRRPPLISAERSCEESNADRNGPGCWLPKANRCQPQWHGNCQCSSNAAVDSTPWS